MNQIDSIGEVEDIEKGKDTESDIVESLEHFRLSGRSPLKTILYLSIGPILAQVTGALNGIISTVWVSTALGEIAVTAISTISVYDGLSRSFGFFLSSASSSKISQLYGQRHEEEASQFIVDILRISLLLGIVVPSILGPTVKPLSKWLGASDDVVEQCQKYMLPINILTFSTIIFVGLGGCLQGEGRSLFFSVLNICTLISNMCILNPLLLLGFRVGIWGASMGQAFSEFIPGCILFIMYFMGKFGVKPKLNQFFKPFSPHILPSLKIGVSQLILNISQMIPSILVRKFLGLAYGPEGYNDAIAGFNTFIRFMILTNSVIIAFTLGFVPAASYSFAAQDYRRWIKLSLHCIWLTFLWGSFTSVLTWSIPRQLSLMFGKSEGYLNASAEQLKIGNSLGFIVFGRFCGIAFLQTMQMGGQASLLSLLCHFMATIVFSCILYYTDKHNGPRIMWCYALSYVFGLFAQIIPLMFPLRKMYLAIKHAEHRNDDDDDQVEEEDNNYQNNGSNTGSGEIGTSEENDLGNENSSDNVTEL